MFLVSDSYKGTIKYERPALDNVEVIIYNCSEHMFVKEVCCGTV